MCKKQTSVSHSSTESEIISLDAGLRLDEPLALDLWDLVIEVLRSSNSARSPTNPAAVRYLFEADCGRENENSNTRLDHDLALHCTSAGNAELPLHVGL